MAIFGFKNKVGKQIEELRTFIATVKTAGASVDYSRVRAEFNLRALTILSGTGFQQNQDGTWSTKGWSALPNKTEYIETQKLINDFIENVEPMFIVTASDDDDMSIINPTGRIVQDVESINNSKFKEIIMKSFNKPLCKEDFQTIADLAERLRKHNYKMAAYWAAGLTLAIAAGVGLYMYKKNKAEEEKKEGFPTAEYDDVGSDVVITVDDDMPVVIVTDDAAEVTVLD